MQEIQTLIIINKLKHWLFLEETLLSLDLFIAEKKGAFFHYEIMKTDACCGAGLNIASLSLTESIFL